MSGCFGDATLAGVKAVASVVALYSALHRVRQARRLGRTGHVSRWQGGTLDFSITPALDKAEGAYDQSPEPKYLLVLDKATHFAWADIGWKAARGPIVGYSLAFLNRYVKGDPADPLLTQAAPGVSLLRHPGKP